MKSEPNDRFKQNYEAHRKHLRLEGLQPATIRRKRQTTHLLSCESLGQTGFPAEGQEFG